MMDGRGGCCIARYAAGGSGGGGGDYEMSKIDRIMLRYRPIAPKPADGSALSPGVKVGDKPQPTKSGRGRKKGGGGGGSNGCNNNNTKKGRCNSSSGGGSGSGRKRKPSLVMADEEENVKVGGSGREVTSEGGGLAAVAQKVHSTPVVTLPLLPETPDLTVKNKNPVGSGPVWLNFDGNNINNSCYRGQCCFGDGEMGKYSQTITQGYAPAVVSSGAAIVPRQRQVVGSWVIVDCVTETWGEEDNINGGEDQTRVLARTDEEKIRSLDEDSCPGFISDGWNKVWWTNKAYNEMACSCCTTTGGDEEEVEVMVWVVMRESLPVGCKGFSCRVRCHHRSGHKDSATSAGGSTSTSTTSSTVPCDAWRMESGGFAWRLDVKAALSLGR